MMRVIKTYFPGFKTTHPTHFSLFSNAIIILASSIISNILNFLFNLVTARNLSIEHYGILQTMLNLFNMINVLTVLITIQLLKQLANYISKKKYSSASALVNKSNLFVVALFITERGFVASPELLISNFPLGVAVPIPTLVEFTYKFPETFKPVAEFAIVKR